MLRVALLALAALAALLAGASPQDYKTAIGFDALKAWAGTQRPTGAGIKVMQVETVHSRKADPAKNVTAARGYSPDPRDRQFRNVKFTGAFATSASAHATKVGRLFYGANSIAPDVAQVAVMSSSNFLRHLMNGSPGSESYRLLRPGSVVNHSWVGGGASSSGPVLRRLDWTATAWDQLHIYGVRNKGTNSPLFAGAFNGVSVGRSDGKHAISVPRVDDVYRDGRVRPEIVAPQSWTSSAAPIVSAAGALLYETITRDDAQRRGRAVLVKALLLAGASRSLPGYMSDAPQSNGLDRRYGAGEVNIDNSFQIAVQGEADSAQDDADGAPSGLASGFDYDPAFGGAAGSNRVAHYEFEAGSAREFAAALVWHARVGGFAGGRFDGTIDVFDLNLALLDLSDGRRIIARSAGDRDTTENLWTTLDSGHRYCLEVTLGAEQAEFSWPYALAWQSR